MAQTVTPAQFGIPETISILIVDDTEVIRKVMLMLFSKLGIPADAVENGLDAVERIRTTVYTLVLMDIRMPLMDGLLATKIIRSELGEKGPIIIGLSGDSAEDDAAQCREAGMDAHITKPPKVESLLSLIGELIAAKREIKTD